MTEHKNYTDAELGYPTEPHGRIPSFANREEEAAFWDTHDFTEFADDATPVAVTIGPELAGRVAGRVTVHLEPAEREALAKRAQEQGTDLSTLARTWLTERLRQETEAEATTH